MSQNIQVIDTVQRQPGDFEILGIPIYYFSFVAIFLFLMAYFRLAKKKSKPRNQIAIIGERYSGKTQLFISLKEGKKFPTAPSIKNNQTQYSLNGKKLKMIDYHGDGISKQEVLSRISEMFCIIHVLDGSNQSTFSDAAMLIYRVLISKSYQSKNCQYFIFLNKDDEKGYVGMNKARQKLQDEIEHIKNSRINSGEQDKEDQQDYIKLSKGRFKIPFKIIEGSAHTNIKDLQLTLENL